MTPQKKYSRNRKSDAAPRIAPLSAPSLDANVKPVVSAKARWADLQGRVVQRSSVKTSLRRQQLEQNDVWDRMAKNEKLRGQLDVDDSSSESDEEDAEVSQSGGRRPKRRRGGIKVWVHVHDQNYPEVMSDHVTKFALNAPSQTFLFPLGKGMQDFRWLSIGSMRRFTSVYKPRGRVRHREWYVGPGDINLRAQQVFLNKNGGHAERNVHKKKQPQQQQQQQLVDIETAQQNAAAILGTARSRSDSKSLPCIQENTPLHKVLKDGDHVWIHFQNGSPTALLAGGSASEMTCVDVFRRTRLHSGESIAPMPPLPKKKEIAVAAKKEFRLEDSVFARRATSSDSGDFYDTNEYYNKVCDADLSYCNRLIPLCGGDVEFQHVKVLLQDNYRCIREAFRYHVAQSRGGTFEMSWLDFSSFAKYCQLVDAAGENPFGYQDLDNIWVAVNCHQNNTSVDQHHVRFLSRFEFLESLVRIALAKYGAGVKASSAVEHMLNAHIIPYFKHMDANVFRRVKLYSPSTAQVLDRFKPSLKLAFREYAVTCTLAYATRTKLSQLSLTSGEFTALLEAARLISTDDSGLTRKTVHGIFIFSQNTVLDEHQRSRRDSLRDDNKTMSFEEFLEALARSADAWDTETSNFEMKITRFLQALCSGLSL